MRQKNLVQQIKETIKEGKVKEPFKPKCFDPYKTRVFF